MLGSNDMPDDISGEVTLVARHSLVYLASGPYEATGAGMLVEVRGVNAQVVSAPVPEPGSYTLMLAGLAALGIVAKRGALPRCRGSRRGRQVAV